MPQTGPRLTRGRLAVAALAALALLPGCIELPAWETYFTVPLVSDTVCPVELFDSTLFRMTDSSVDLYVELDFDTVQASDNFGRFTVSDIFVFPLGAFTLPRFDAAAGGYAIWDVHGIQPEDSVLCRFGRYVREFPFRFPLPGVDSAVLGGGGFVVRIDNRTRVPLHRVSLELEEAGAWLLGTAPGSGSATASRAGCCWCPWAPGARKCWSATPTRSWSSWRSTRCGSAPAGSGRTARFP
jgi:hypothetical protein